MSVFICDKETFNFTVRMSWSISEILKPFKKPAVMYSGLKTLALALSF